MTSYEPQSFWEKRLTREFGFSGVCHAAFNDFYNRWLHRARMRALRKALAKIQFDPSGKSLLDLGCGTGLIIDFFRQRGAQACFGVDLTSVSIQNLQQQYPQCTFLQSDIAAPDLPARIDRRFDIVTAFDVFYHLPDRPAFDRALSNAAALLRPGGILIVTDGAGRQDVQHAPHVCWRSRSAYDSVLSARNAEILATFPMYSILNEPFLSALAPARLKPLARRADNLAAPLYYLLDRLLIHVRPGPLRLILARKLDKSPTAES